MRTLRHSASGIRRSDIWLGAVMLPLRVCCGRRARPHAPVGPDASEQYPVPVWWMLPAGAGTPAVSYHCQLSARTATSYVISTEARPIARSEALWAARAIDGSQSARGVAET